MKNSILRFGVVNDVRKDIPEIPEVKYYDKQLEALTEYVEEVKGSIPEVPEQKTYDEEIEAICGLIDELKEEVRKHCGDTRDTGIMMIKLNVLKQSQESSRNSSL